MLLHLSGNSSPLGFYLRDFQKGTAVSLDDLHENNLADIEDWVMVTEISSSHSLYNDHVTRLNAAVTFIVNEEVLTAQYYHLKPYVTASKF